ncbi:Hypothetical protein Minf_1336 [Methylacidiphilum infernorum V4]|uniref:Uncharacterized protein n=1 Tax=Methylacidiphilum infernorum (isolate V4) TaxID=481448 RepID=B3DVN7_METI4|nr:Hypothetical protein Minf_1336 [Methylacidiphilum infernorum V4]
MKGAKKELSAQNRSKRTPPTGNKSSISPFLGTVKSLPLLGEKEKKVAKGDYYCKMESKMEQARVSSEGPFLYISFF